MVSQHPAKFRDHKHSGSGDMMFLVEEKQDSMSLQSAITLYL